MAPETLERVAFKNEILLLVSAPLVRQAIGASGETLEVLPPLEIREELNSIYRAFENTDLPVAFHIRVEVATSSLINTVFATRYRPLIVHFIGHGIRHDAQEALVIEESDGLARPLSKAQLRRILDPLKSPPCKLAILNACHSAGFAEILIEKGVEHVVAVKADDVVLDAAARCFTKNFYPPLLNGLTIAEAYETACTGVLDDDQLRRTFNPDNYDPANLDESLKFQLLPADSPDHIAFLDSEPVPGPVTFPPWDRTNVSPVSPSPFIGRQEELYDLAKALQNISSAKCLLVKGFAGMGKTALALAAARWQRERDRWSEGVWFIDLQDEDKAAQARGRIAVTLQLPSAAAASNAGLYNSLASWNALLILDDLDQLINEDPDATSDLLDSLLGCPRLRLLVTSRRDLPGQVFHSSYVVSRLSTQAARIAFETYAPPIEEWRLDTTYREDISEILDFLDGYPFPIRLTGTYMSRTCCSLRTLRMRLLLNPDGTLRYPIQRIDRATSLFASLELLSWAASSRKKSLPRAGFVSSRTKRRSRVKDNWSRKYSID